MKGSRRIIAVLGGVLAAGVLAAGCDTNEDANLDRGRELFVTKCGTCHILAEAATTGVLGPDLDAAFAQMRANGSDSDFIEGIVEGQIANPRTVRDPQNDPSFMPAALVEGQDAEDVATYIASVAGVPGIEPPEAVGGEGGQVFANNGCGGCHTFAAAQSEGVVGPNLDEVLAGQTPEQIAQSIVDPEAAITSGFSSGGMPATFGDAIPPADLELLVDFLLGGEAGGGADGEASPEPETPAPAGESKQGGKPKPGGESKQGGNAKPGGKPKQKSG